MSGAVMIRVAWGKPPETPIPAWTNPEPDPLIIPPEPIPGETPRQFVHRIQAEVAARHGISVADMMSRSRLKIHCRPRQEAMCLLLATKRFSSPKIGQMFGGRDHTTALHADKKHRARVAERMGLA